jgi:hypothetical protein
VVSPTVQVTTPKPLEKTPKTPKTLQKPLKNVKKKPQAPSLGAMAGGDSSEHQREDSGKIIGKTQ